MAESKGTEGGAPPGSGVPDSDGKEGETWKDFAKRDLAAKLDRRVALAKKSKRLDLADPGPEKHNIFRFHLDVIPRSIERVFASGKLRELWLTNNHFNVIPAFVEQLPNLQTLCLSGNQLSSISRPLFKCTKLQRLLLARNHIVALPPEFAELTELRELRLDHNQLARFPSALCSLRSLRRLGLSFNRIDSVPPRVRRLTNLIELDLDNNRIGPELPVELMRLSGLTVLGVANNCLEAAPALGKRPPGAVPLSVVRLSGNRSSKYKVYHDSGMLLEGENIPKRADGYLELRKGYLVTDLEGQSHHRVEELEGYVTEGYRHNVTSANWYRQADEFKVIKARAKVRRMRAAVQKAEASS